MEWCTLGAMQQQGREQTVLRRLWELQADAGLSDSALARRIGVDQSNVSRAKHGADNPDRSVSVKFLLGACDTFPELVFLLFPDLHARTGTMHRCTEQEGAA